MNRKPHAAMKATASILVICAPLLAAQQSTTGEPPKVRFRDAATHEQLARIMRKADQIDPMDKLEPSKGEDPSKVNQPADLLASSDVISFGGVATLVPKRAILSAPKGVKDRVCLQKGVRIVSWLEFASLNRGWITTVEVSRVQAEGNKPIAEETLDRISKSSNLVVATLMGGPISVLPLKEEAKEEQANNAKP
jgi:hypothetical protein